MACDTFQYTNTGFTATISTEKDVPVFFSIPYESGWTAYVNGEKADIERVNVGFMAIRVNAGTNVEIEFVYETPGLLLGGLITLLCIALLCALSAVHARGRKVPPPDGHPRAQHGRVPAFALRKETQHQLYKPYADPPEAAPESGPGTGKKEGFYNDD